MVATRDEIDAAIEIKMWLEPREGLDRYLGANPAIGPDELWVLDGSEIGKWIRRSPEPWSLSLKANHWLPEKCVAIGYMAAPMIRFVEDQDTPLAINPLMLERERYSFRTKVQYDSYELRLRSPADKNMELEIFREDPEFLGSWNLEGLISHSRDVPRGELWVAEGSKDAEMLRNYLRLGYISEPLAANLEAQHTLDSDSDYGFRGPTEFMLAGFEGLRAVYAPGITSRFMVNYDKLTDEWKRLLSEGPFGEEQTSRSMWLFSLTVSSAKGSG